MPFSSPPLPILGAGAVPAVAHTAAAGQALTHVPGSVPAPVQGQTAERRGEARVRSGRGGEVREGKGAKGARGLRGRTRWAPQASCCQSVPFVARSTQLNAQSCRLSHAMPQLPINTLPTAGGCRLTPHCQPPGDSPLPNANEQPNANCQSTAHGQQQSAITLTHHAVLITAPAPPCGLPFWHRS